MGRGGESTLNKISVKSHGSGRAKPGPGQSQLLWPGSEFSEARASVGKITVAISDIAKPDGLIRRDQLQGKSHQALVRCGQYICVDSSTCKS
jgi:hypothetical protein